MVKKVEKVAFDSKVFLASGNRSRTISNYRKDEVIFSQAEPADAVFYIQRGKVKRLWLLPSKGRKPSSPSLDRASFSGKDA
jgi:CRP-like cAMP-binding protein